MVTFNGKTLAQVAKNNTANLDFYQNEILWYSIKVDDQVLRFPVPISATGDAEYRSSERAGTMLKFISKEMNRLDVLIQEEKQNEKNYK